MAAVQQRVLNWLYSVLTSEYHDVNRAYNDVARALSHYSSLSPRTDVHTNENGTSALLLQISGTIPVTFRDVTYRFPISIWLPHAYPREAPLVYVTPTQGMMVRAGQHVDPQGKIYHPYLARWADFLDNSDILALIAILRDVFAKEPPVVSRGQPAPPPMRPQPNSMPPSVPPLPPDIARSPQVSDPQARPPPPPPKPHEISGMRTQSPVSMRSPQDASGPPLPPLPPKTTTGPDGSQSPSYGPSSALPLNQPQRSSSLRYESAPPLPPQTPSRHQSLRDPTSYGAASPLSGPAAYDRQAWMPHPQNQQMPPHQQSQAFSTSGPPPQFTNCHQTGPVPAEPSSGHYRPLGILQPQPQVQKPPPPLVDLLDGPLTLSLPSDSEANLPAPPIPPNPEKDMLLRTLAQQLYAQRQHSCSQTDSSLPGLRAQNAAMLQSLSAMRAEQQALESLSATLSSNTSILHKALHDADKVIQDSGNRKVPGIDEILVAPTVVGNQLYELVNEERALGDALFVLGKAVQKGRLSTSVFVKTTRGLAREWFLKKALAKKIGQGMGLAEYH